MEKTLPNMGGTTLARRLTVQLLKELRSGKYARTQRLPSEVELAQEFAVSRSVVRDAMANLEQEGFVSRGRGVGTLVHRQVVDLGNRIDLKFEYNDLILAEGYQPTADCIKLYTQAADYELADKLQIDADEPLVVCEKRMLASGVPVIYSVDHLPARIFSGKDYTTFDWSAPVFSILETYCSISVDTDIATLSATMGPPAVRELLQLDAQDVLFGVDEIGYYRLSRPIMHTYGYYTDFFDFSVLRKKY